MRGHRNSGHRTTEHDIPRYDLLVIRRGVIRSILNVIPEKRPNREIVNRGNMGRLAEVFSEIREVRNSRIGASVFRLYSIDDTGEGRRVIVAKDVRAMSYVIG